MKTLMPIIILIEIFISPAQAQNTYKSQSGSWINQNVIKYYMNGQGLGCNIKDFDNDKFIPLSISFKSTNKLVVVFRAEQSVAYYIANYSDGNLVSISNKKNIYKVEQSNDILMLNYHGNKIQFKKVSDNFSNDVFMEFIKNLIFNNHSFLTLRLSNSNKITKVTKDDIIEKLKGVFRCDLLEAVQLGTFKDGERCLPEIVAYHKINNQLSSPQIFGVVIDPGRVTFIDSSMNSVAILKPN